MISNLQFFVLRSNILRFFVLLLLFYFFSKKINAQSPYAPLNVDYHHWIDRLDIKSGGKIQNLHSSLKPYPRHVLAQIADSTEKWDNLSKVDKFNIQFLKDDNWEWSADSLAGNSEKAFFIKKLYKKKGDLYNYQNKDADFHISPVFSFSGGKDQNTEGTPFFNGRGLEIRGNVGKKIGFYTYFTDNQALFPTYILDRVTAFNAVPNEGYYKRGVGQRQVDFITARGYISFPIYKKVIDAQFGYDRNFMGNGYRSMVLSDNSSNYLFFKINTKIGNVQYQNMFAQLTSEVLPADGQYPQKYMALHHLSWNITHKLNVGIFESIIFNRGDSLKNGNFDFRYLNPIIFYRSIEQQAGSPDNANLGVDFKWNIKKRVSLYGQIFLDEFVLSQVRNRSGWRGNKQAGQFGVKYIDVLGVKNLDLQTELNIARPYTYSHNQKYNEYSNYNQALAHPLGANFYEFVGIVRCQPFPRWNFVSKTIYAQYGQDELGKNWGGNIFKNNSDFVQEFNNTIAQGIKTNLLLAEFCATWHIKHNLFIDFRHLYRKVSTDEKATNYTSIGLRLNFAPRQEMF